jgi:hypothetical protein
MGFPAKSTPKIKECCRMKYRPLHDRVIVQRIEEKEMSAGGIIIPDTAKEKPQEGKVIAVGTGIVLKDGKTMRPSDLQQVRRYGSQVRRRNSRDDA